jgi:hypothetical protein
MPATKQWTYSRGKKGTVVGGVEGERRKIKKKDLAAENQEAARSRRLGAALLLI